MKMFLMNGLISNEMMQALCWTLLHSLWQGLVLAIIAALIIMITRKSAPALRYNLLSVLFILFIVATAFTFIQQINITNSGQPETVWKAPVTGSVSNTYIIPGYTSVSEAAQPGLAENIVQYFNEHASLIVAIWFILFLAKLLRILSNIGYVQRIRHYKTSEPPPYWKQRIMEMAKDLRVRRSIQLLESAIIRVPVVVGLLKPVILLPLGILSNLPPEQVEAVLLHELAHIRRKDYLVNLLQSFAEVVYFFNPAVLWISSLIRQERENCCDDVAISQLKNKKQFIHALVAFQEYAMHPSNNNTAIAFAGRKNYLLNRVKRIIYNENKKLNAMEKGFFILSIVAISLVGLVSMKQSPAEQKESSFSILPVTNPSDAVPDPHMERTDTVPAPVEFKDLNAITNKDENGETRTITATVKNGKKYKLVMKNDNSLELFVNDKKIPASEMDTYQPVIDEMEQAVEFRQKKEIEKMKKAQGEQSEKLLKLDAERMELMRKLATIDEERAKLSSEYMRKFKDHEWENAAEMNLHYDNLWKSRQESLNDEFFHFPMELKLNSEDLLHQQLLNESFNKFNTDQLFQQENNELFERQLLQENFNQFNLDQLNQNENNTSRFPRLGMPRPLRGCRSRPGR
jgi:beta-lactamase regulating signal transducer with metallopeptidase domain